MMPEQTERFDGFLFLDRIIILIFVIKIYCLPSFFRERSGSRDFLSEL